MRPNICCDNYEQVEKTLKMKKGVGMALAEKGMKQGIGM